MSDSLVLILTALGSGGFGAVAFRFVQWWIGHRSTEARDLRVELAEDARETRARIEDWTAKYEHVRDQYDTLLSVHASLRATLEAQAVRFAAVELRLARIEVALERGM